MTGTLAELTRRREDLFEQHKLNNINLDGLIKGIYPDKAHFVFELLQNAEDQQATSVRFELRSDQLIFTHDGVVFNIGDIDSITTLADSNKINDQEKIGEKGVGFKSVFIYCNEPRIRSGRYDFRIKNLLAPYGSEDEKFFDGTQFDFPLGTDIKDLSEAVADISSGLGHLNETALLFLNHIQKIEYVLEDGSEYSIEKLPRGDYVFEICKKSSRKK